MELISWHTPEYEHHPKDAFWFWISIAVAALLFGGAIWMRNFFFAGFVIFAEALVIVLADREPRMVEASIDRHEVRVDGRVLPIKELRGWSFMGEPHHKHSHIILHSKSKLSLETVIIVPDEAKEEIVSHLSELLPEEEHEESLIDLLAHYLKF